MGDDTPLAVLSRRPPPPLPVLQAALRPGHEPPIDSIREKSVMSLGMYLGGRLGLFEELPKTSGSPSWTRPSWAPPRRRPCSTSPSSGTASSGSASSSTSPRAPRASSGRSRTSPSGSRRAVETNNAKGTRHSFRTAASPARRPRPRCSSPRRREPAAGPRRALRLRCDIVRDGKARRRPPHRLPPRVRRHAVYPWLALGRRLRTRRERQDLEAVAPEKARAN